MQVDLHIAELTVRETFDFAARVQGTAMKAGGLSHCSARCRSLILYSCLLFLCGLLVHSHSEQDQ